MPSERGQRIEATAMLTVVLVIHVMLTAALIGVVLVQKSEGGGLGIGGSSSGMSGSHDRPLDGQSADLDDRLPWRPDS